MVEECCTSAPTLLYNDAQNQQPKKSMIEYRTFFTGGFGCSRIRIGLCFCRISTFTCCCRCSSGDCCFFRDRIGGFFTRNCGYFLFACRCLTIDRCRFCCFCLLGFTCSVFSSGGSVGRTLCCRRCPSLGCCFVGIGCLWLKTG